MSATERFAAIVLAAGHGTRMKSALTKVLHPIAGRPMVFWPVSAALEAGAERVVVVIGPAHQNVADALVSHFGDRVTTAIQQGQRGTGDAARAGLEALSGVEGNVAILNGDCPLLRPSSVRALFDTLRGVAASGAKPSFAMITCTVDDARSYGRIVRDASGKILCIREHRDANEEERKLREVNPGIYAGHTSFLRKSLAALQPNNAQGELYLTDLVSMAVAEGGTLSVSEPMDDLHGVNDRHELGLAEASMRARINRALAESGVTIRDPASTYVEAGVTVENDAILEPNVILRGKTQIGKGARLDVGCVLEDVKVEANAYLKPYTIASKSRIGAGSQIGPFAHLRPESDLGDNVHIGNFVETKKTTMAAGAKANHLAYLGDGVIGRDVNVGAGTIFCNYDGFQKHVTTLEDGVFIGSDSQLVAPVRVGEGAYVASGTTVVRDVPPGALAISRAKQENKEGYATRIRARMKAAKEAAQKK